MSRGINDSIFHMWRAVFALAHADNVISNEEVRFMAEAIEDVRFSSKQREILKKDIAEPQDPVKMFEQIEDPRDCIEFFNFAHKMVWSDGDYAHEEQAIVKKLKDMHIANVDMDRLVGRIDLQLEDDYAEAHHAGSHKDVRKIISSFKDLFRG